MAQSISTGTFCEAKWVVDPTAGQGTHTTIASAITSASSGDTIFIRPGTYTENLTLKAGVNLAAFNGDQNTPNVTIIGNNTLTTAGTVSISNIRLLSWRVFINNIDPNMYIGVLLHCIAVYLNDNRGIFNL